MIRRYLPGGYRSLRGLTIGSILLTMLMQGVIWRMLPRDTFWGLDPGARFFQVINFSLQNQSLAYSGQVLDPAQRFVPFKPPFAFEHMGKVYGIYNPLFVALSSLFYRLFSFDGLYIIPLLSSFATLVLTTLLIREVAPRWQALIPLVVGLGSPLLFYALTFWEHTLGVGLATGSVLLCYRSHQRNAPWSGLFLAGIAAGFAFVFRPELSTWCLAMLVSALFVWPKHRVRMFIAFSAGVMLVIGLFQLYEWIIFRALVRRHITNNYGGFFLLGVPAWIERQVSFMMTFLLPSHQRSFWLLLWGGVGGLVILFLCVRQPVVQRTVRVLMLLLMLVMSGLLLQNIGSTLIFDDITQTFPPICFTALAFVMPRAPSFVRAERLLRFLFGTVVIFLVLVFLTTFNDASGGQWGPRYLMVIVPAFTVIIFGCVAHWERGTTNRLFVVPADACCSCCCS